MGLYNGIPRVLLALESHMSILSYCPMWDRLDCPMESHVYHSHLNPTCPSCPIVPCGTHGTVHWNPKCTIHSSIPCFCPILLFHVPCGTDGTVQYGIPCVPLVLESHMSLLHVSFWPMWDRRDSKVHFGYKALLNIILCVLLMLLCKCVYVYAFY